MIVAGLLRDWFGLPDGSVLTNLVASFMWTIPTLAVAARHFRCQHCWRPARVPVSGTPHHVCKHHAIKHGHTHP